MGELTLAGFAGIRNTVAPERVRGTPGRDGSLVDLVAAVNVDLDDSGALARRAGQQLVVAGAAHSLWANDDDCLFVQDGRLYRLHRDLSHTLLADGLAAAPLSYVAVNGRIYFSNGVQSGVLDGACREWGIAAPQVAALTPIAGQLGAGSYQVALTFQRADGQESGAGLAHALTLGDGAGVRVAWQPPGPAVTAVNVYLSEANGMVPYLAASAAPGQGSVDLTGAPLAYPLATQWLDAPPPGQYLAYSNGRIYIAAGQFVYATAPHGYEYVDLRDYLAIDGSRIGFLCGMVTGLYIGTARGVYFASGTRLDQMELHQLDDAACIPGSGLVVDAVAVTGNPDLAGRNVALFATDAGIYLGNEDGSATNLSAARYQFAPGTSSVAGFRDSPTLKQYLLFMA